jgi:phage shock protein E
MIVIDVRTKEEFESGHVEGAINIDFYREDLKEVLAKLDKSKKYGVYCRSGARSSRVVELMKELGFDVEDLGALT